MSMQTKTKAKLLRWKDIFLYAAFGTVAYVYPARLWQRALNGRFLEWFEYPLLAAACQSSLGVLLLFFGLHISGARWRHFKHSRSYPSFLMSVIVACFCVWLLPGIPAGILEIESVPLLEAITALLLFSALWGFYVGIRVLLEYLEKPAPRSSILCEVLEERKISDDALMNWLQREEPLHDCYDDLFGRKFIAERLLRRLEEGQNTIALQGYLGSGKSSIVSMAKTLALEKQKSLIFVQVSCWGFESAARAQEEILRQLLRDLGEELDCFAIKNVPIRYVEAMSEHGGWLKSAAKLATMDLSPVEQLRQISPLLNASGYRAVIFIDDVDRNGQHFDISLIQALLVQLRNVEGLSFVLSISPTQHLDFAKFCEFIELIPKLSEGEVLNLINQAREHLLNQNPPAVIVDPLEPLKFEDDPHTTLYRSAEYHIPWGLSLYSLLSNPRHLKHMLRRIRDVWPKLAGEVNMDDLISISTLRTAAPAAFSFYLERNALFEAAANEERTNIKDEFKTKIFENLRREWTDVCQKNAFDSLAVAWLIQTLDQRSQKVLDVQGATSQRKQSVGNKKRGFIYLRRLINEELDEDDTLDTPILKSLRDASFNPEEIKHLAERITDSNAASDAFEHLVSCYDFTPHLLSFTTEIYACIRQRHGSKTNFTSHPGFFASWRVLKNALPISLFEDWLINELEKCMPNNMHLLGEIYYYWLGSNKHSRKEREKPRAAIFNQLQSAWSQMPSGSIGDGFDPSYPYTLFHLIFTSEYIHPSEVPLSSAEDWKWIGPLLFETITKGDEVMIPQLVLALDSLVKKGGEEQPYELDETTLSVWFPKREREVVEFIAAGFSIHEQVDARTKLRLKSAIRHAKSWLHRRLTTEAPKTAKSAPKSTTKKIKRRTPKR